MAGPCICHNFPLTNKHELTKDALGALIKSSGTPTPIFAISCISISMPA